MTENFELKTEALEAETITMGEALPFFIKKIWWIPLMALLAGGLGVVYAFSQKKVYATEMQIMPMEEGGRTLRFSAEAFSLKAGMPSFVGNEAEDFIKSLLNSRDFRFACLRRSGFEKDEEFLGLDQKEAKKEDVALKLNDMLKISSTPDGATIIRVFGPDPQKIKVFGDALLEELRQRYRSTEEKVIKFLERELLEPIS